MMGRPLLSIRRSLRRIALFLLAALVVAPLASTEVRFVLRATLEEARILLKRKPIEELLADASLPAVRREQLRLVLDARAFAAEQLGLKAGETYTTFSDVGDGHLLQVLSASPKDRLEGYRWTYPIVGSVPYKGFFQESAAKAEQQRLEQMGFDTYMRPAGAFSTLGWFNDPLLSTALDDDPVELVVTVIHEIAHNTLWVPSDARFNESYANFVGFRGGEAFFLSRGEYEAAARCAAMWRDEMRLGTFYSGLEQQLQGLYAAELNQRVVESRRNEIFDRARAELAGTLGRELEIYSGQRLSRAPLNNARLISSRIYLTGLDQFDRMFHARGGNLREGIQVLKTSLQRHPKRRPLDVLAIMGSGAQPG